MAMAQVGDIFESEITAMASSGAGIARHKEGVVVFVPGTWVGDRAQIEIETLKKNFASGRLIDLISPSSQRVDPPCKYFGHQKGKCGACVWQMASYSSQLKEKDRAVAYSLKKLRGHESLRLYPIHPSSKELGYRNRVRLKTDGKSLGYLSHASHHFVSVNECPVLNEDLQKKFQILRQRLVDRPEDEPKTELNFFDLDEDTDPYTQKMGHAVKFRQANHEQNRFMKEWLKEKMRHFETTPQVALELFCGDGNFSEVLISEGVQELLALEGSQEAIERLRAKKLPGLRAEVSNLFKDDFVEAYAEFCDRVELLFLDPPRDGWKNKTSFLKRAKNLKKLLYVSCHLATFVRDLRDFEEAGFKVIEVQPLDQFPQTPHIEMLALLEKN